MEDKIVGWSACSLAPIPLFGRIPAPVCTLDLCKIMAHAFSAKDAKNLSEFCRTLVSRAKLVVRVVCFDMVAECIIEECERAANKFFWTKLLDPAARKNVNMHELYGVACVLFTQEHNARVHSSLQRVAAAVMYELYPEAFHFPHAQVFHRFQNVHIFRMHAWFEDGWRFSAFMETAATAMCARIGTVDARVVEQSNVCVEPSPYYKTKAQFLTTKVLLDAPLKEVGCQELIVEEGASVMIRLVSPNDPLVRFDADNNNLKGIPGDLDEAWVRKKVALREPFMVLERYLGLTHPQRPFAVSAAAIVLENEDDIAQVHGIAEQIGHDFEVSSILSIPLSFPPALSDRDKNLQRVMCRLALSDNESCAVDAVVEAAQAVAEELLGETVEELGNLDEEELASILDGANFLVRQALEALHRAQLDRLRSQTVVNYIVDVLLTEAWFQIKCRNEWKQVEARVERWAKERSCQNKRTKKKNRSHAPSSDSAPRSTSLKSAVKELQSRTASYAKTAKGVASLVASGLACAVPLPPEQSGHHGQLPELTIEILPPRATKTLSKASTHVQHGIQMQTHRKQHFLQVLEASVVKDYNLALAHREEAELHLALRMSLYDEIDNKPSVRCIGQGEASSTNEHADTEHAHVDCDGVQHAIAFLNGTLCERGDMAPKTENILTMDMPMISEVTAGRSRAHSAPPVLQRNHLPFTSLAHSSSGGDHTSSEALTSSRDLPTTSSESVIIFPKHRVALSTSYTLLEDGLLPSFGTVDHSAAPLNKCFVCRAFQRDGECRDGRACRRCHAPHSVDSIQRGGGRTRQRAARMKAKLRQTFSPDRFFWE